MAAEMVLRGEARVPGPWSEPRAASTNTPKPSATHAGASLGPSAVSQPAGADGTSCFPDAAPLSTGSTVLAPG